MSRSTTKCPTNARTAVRIHARTPPVCGAHEKADALPKRQSRKFAFSPPLKSDRGQALQARPYSMQVQSYGMYASEFRAGPRGNAGTPEMGGWKTSATFYTNVRVATSQIAIQKGVCMYAVTQGGRAASCYETAREGGGIIVHVSAANGQCENSRRDAC